MPSSRTHSLAPVAPTRLRGADVVIGRRLFAIALTTLLTGTAWGSQYTLRFNRTSSRMSWNHRLPSWQFSIPVRSIAGPDSATALRVSTSASLSYILDERNDVRTWQDRGLVNWSIDYPVLGPKAEVGVSGNVETRNATLQKQKIRNQTYGARLQYKPLDRGAFRTLRVHVAPGLITATRVSRAKLDSTIEEHGVQYDAQISTEPVFRVRGRKLNTSMRLTKRDNTLENNKDLFEELSLNMGYKLPRKSNVSLAVSEARSQRGVTRSVVEAVDASRAGVVGTTISADIAATRNTSVTSKVDFKVLSFKLDTRLSYAENLNTNTASDAEDLGNKYFGTDRESKQWRLGTNVSGKLIDQLVVSTSINHKVTDQGFLPVEFRDGGRYRDESEDRKDRDLAVNASLDWQVRAKHTLKFSSQVRSIRDENRGAPEQNRDTFRNTSAFSYSGTYASGLQLTVGVGSSFYHRVNLHASRSSDNSRNRDLNLDINTRYERLGASITHTFGVSARRTIYDFDRQVNPRDTDRRSNIRRGWSMRHAIQRRLTAALQVSSSYAYKADDFGRFIVEDNAQIVEEDNSDHTASCGVLYRPNKSFSVATNYTYRLDRQWDHEYDNFREFRSLVIRNKHENLSVTFDYKPSKDSTLNFRSSRSRQLSGTFDTFNIGYVRTI